MQRYILFVYSEAFKLITGIGESTLQVMREAVAKGQQSFFTRQERGMFMEIKCHAKAAAYVDARAWLEEYAEAHAEQSPITGLYLLPAGRRSFYHLAYLHDRKQDRRREGHQVCAKVSTFLAAWRTELPHILVGSAEGTFTVCGVCVFLQRLMDTSLRGSLTGQVARDRLGQHYAFQSAQRLRLARYEEQARRSDGEFWLLKMDKADHSGTKCPTVWSQFGAQHRAKFSCKCWFVNESIQTHLGLQHQCVQCKHLVDGVSDVEALEPWWPRRASPLMKLGERLVVSINGAMVHGVKGAPPYHIETLFEDAPHGAAMQSSCFLHLFHRCALQQKSLPRQVAFGADNTAKETKNSTACAFAMWLLAITIGMLLYIAAFMFLLVGHTHDSLVGALAACSFAASRLDTRCDKRQNLRLA